MIFHDIQQNTPEWDLVKLGKFSGSNFSNLMMDKKNKGYKDIIYRVAYERLTGKKADEGFNSYYTNRGHEYEPIAKEWYELETFNKIHNGGFVELNEWVGCSPDGLLSDNKGLEIKCPKFNTMIEYLKYKELPAIYKWQVQGSMYVCDYKEWDFLAFDINLPKLLLTIKRDQKAIDELRARIDEAIEEVEKIINKLKG